MADERTLSVVRRYLRRLRDEFGLDVSAGVLFGSHASGVADQWSDVDVVVLAGRFDAGISSEDVEMLWWVAANTDSRIEPIACGVRQWQDDDRSAIIEIARREGTLVAAYAA